MASPSEPFQAKNRCKEPRGLQRPWSYQRDYCNSSRCFMNIVSNMDFFLFFCFLGSHYKQSEPLRLENVLYLLCCLPRVVLCAFWWQGQRGVPGGAPSPPAPAAAPTSPPETWPRGCPAPFPPGTPPRDVSSPTRHMALKYGVSRGSSEGASVRDGHCATMAPAARSQPVAMDIPN